LGADWIYHHNPVELGYKRMTLKETTTSGHVVTFHDESLPNSIHIADGHNLNKLLLDSICGVVVKIKPTGTFDIHQTTYPKGIQKLLQ
jgi:hypothetical protein